MIKKSKNYDHRAMEKKWTKKWLDEGVYEPDLKNAKRPFYNLMMFPYPSAEGLHVGNMYAFTGSDIYGRFKRMQGFDVFEPIGLDGFGIHSENYALKVGAHPLAQSRVSEKRFYEQLKMAGNGFAWNERLETYDPEYYRWTQWLFVQMWRHGLAYRKKQAVNWCPSCKTVLADEQVIKKSKSRDGVEEGITNVCERCETRVIKKELEQWFFRITKYADKLLENLETIDWSERVKIAQRNWIGRSEGALIKFRIQTSKCKTGANAKLSNKFVEVFTTRPDTLFGATYMVVAPEHKLINDYQSLIANCDEVKNYIARSNEKSEEERLENREKTGVELKGIKAVNPANNEEIPIFVADYVLAGYGTGAIMAVPAHDERDFEFAKKFDLPVRVVISPNYPEKKRPVLHEAFTGKGKLVHSGKFDGMDSEKVKWEITKFVGGKRHTQYRLRDWLISRQRYWGPPIPMIHCEACAAAGKGEREDMPGWYAVPEEELPVKLPMVKDFHPKGMGQSPLASVRAFYETKCPGCGGPARRETDVSDTFLDSAWYYIRYPSVHAEESELKIKNSKLKIPWNREITRRWLPVGMYIGGAEHSVLHLLYVRFVALALRDMKLLDFPSDTGEPFPRFRAHGLVIKDGAKMSKSRGNVVNPDEYVKTFGADAFRMYLMFLAPFEQGGDFRDQGILGVERFLKRVWILREKLSDTGEESVDRKVHETIKKVTEDIESLHYNTAVSALMILLNEFETAGAVSKEQYKTFLKLIAPFTPFLAEELWQETENGKRRAKNVRFQSIHKEKWPEYDPRLLVAKTFMLVIQVNGKVRDQFEMPVGTKEAEALECALASEKIQRHIGGKELKKKVYVPGRLLNLVV